MYSKGSSSVVAIILMVGVCISISSIAYVTVFNSVDTNSNKPLISSYLVEQNEECKVNFDVLKSNRIDKFIINGSSVNSSYTTKMDVWSKKLNVTDGYIYLKAINNTNEQQQILYNEKINTSGSFCSDFVFIGDRYLNIGDSKVYNFDYDPPVIGPPNVDYIGSDMYDIPLVDSSGNLIITELNGTSKKLVDSSDTNNPRTSKSRIATSDWKGENSVYYVDENKDIYKVYSNKTIEPVKDPENGANAVLGSSDVDADDEPELVFADASQQLRYIEKNGDVKVIDEGQLGSNNGIGVTNSITDFNNDGADSVVGVDGSNNIFLTSKITPKITISEANAVKAPITALDIENDGEPEILYTDKSTGHIYYVDNVLSSNTIKVLKNSDGDPINGDDESGLTS